MAKATKKRALKAPSERLRKKRKPTKPTKTTKSTKTVKQSFSPPSPAGTTPATDAAATAGNPSFVLDRLWGVVTSRRDADPAVSHSARLLARGTAKIAQKFGEEAVECLIEASLGNRQALIAESADVLYHLIVMWVNAGVRTDEVWAELQRREGVSGIAERAARVRALPLAFGVRSTKIP